MAGRGRAGACSSGATRLEGGGETFTVLADPSGHPFCLCASADGDRADVAEVAIDCPTARRSAGSTPSCSAADHLRGPEGAVITADGKLPIMFQNVEDYHPPQWPDPAHPQQYHLDIGVDDVEAEEARVLALGATRLPGGGGDRLVSASSPTRSATRSAWCGASDRRPAEARATE